MYTTLDIAYNDNSAELDKMAREMNNKKTNLFKSVYNDYENKQKKWENDIIEYNNSYKNPYGYFNSHPDSDKSDKSDSSISINSSRLSSNKSHSKSYDSDFEDNLDSISIDSPSLDSYIDNVKEKPEKRVSIHNFIKKLKNNKKHHHIQEDDIFTHIKYCFECREQLLKYMKNHKNNDNLNNIDEFDKNIKDNQSLFSYFGTIQTKEVFIIIILGIVLIIILDFLMRTPYSVL